MYELTLIKQDGGAYIDSREVAFMIGRRHDKLLRDIAGYLKTMDNSIALKVEGDKFFIENSYTDARGREKPCYLLSKLGCGMVANKLSGEKGILFTALYVTKYNELEAAERMEAIKRETERLSVATPPSLSDCNQTARIIVRAMQNTGSSPAEIVQFLKELYEPFDIAVSEPCELADCEIRYTAKEMAEELGIYSTNGKPHAHAVACILNEYVCIHSHHKTVVPFEYTDCKFGGCSIGVSTQYDECAMMSVWKWILENDFPAEIEGSFCTYRVQYGSQSGDEYVYDEE